MLGPFVVNTTLSKWFVIKRGRVIALASLGGSLGGVIPRSRSRGIVDRWGWEVGWVVMGIVTLVLMLPCSLVMRRQPEDYGLLPDGKTGDEEQTVRELAQNRGSAERLRQLVHARRGDAHEGDVAAGPRVRARRGGGGIRVLARDPVHDRCRLHALPGRLRIRRAGRRGDGVEVLLGVGDANALSAHPDRAHDRDDGRSVGAAGSGRGISLGALLVVFALFGFGVGGMFPLFDFVWAWYFGRRHIGAVRSTGFPISVVIAVTGPILTGLYFDSVGDYNGAFFTLAAVLAVGAVLLLSSHKPPPQIQAEPAEAATPAG